MGLFSNDKKPCPICGKATPRLLATKIDGIPICKECNNKADLPDGMMEQMSLEDFREYLTFYERNQALRNVFSESFRFDHGFGSTLLLDNGNRLLRLKDSDSSLVLEASALKGFRILEDNRPLFESTTDGLRCSDSSVPEAITAILPQIAQFTFQRLEYERREQREKLEQRDGNRPFGYQPRPTFDYNPFRHFYVELHFEHPYWKQFRMELDAPSFNSTYPDANDYMREYQEKTNELHALAVNLMQLINPNAGEVTGEGTAPQAPAACNAIDEIKRYKALLDEGLITNEEFTAKKRQLLGI